MRKKKLMFVFVGLAFAVHAQVISIHPVNGTAVYRAGETARWAVSVREEGAPVSGGQVDFIVKSGGVGVAETGKADITNGSATLEAMRKTPGALLLEVRFRGSTNYAGALFSPEEVLPSAEEPSDFEEFWQDKVAELQAVPMNAVLEKEDGHAGVDYWKITMDNIRGTRIYGQLAKPENSSGPLPAVVEFQYAGVYPLKKEWVVSPAKEGWLALNIMAHDLPIDREASFYKEMQAGPLNGYPAIGCEDRDTSYFLRMYLACYRALDYLTQRPDWNGEVLLVTGGSQGGMQAVMAAGFHPAVTAVIANVPAGCDLTGKLADRAPGWPTSYWRRKESAMKMSTYYDVVNFARRIKCPALIGVGAIDRVCPPEGVAAMFNQLKGPKQLVVLPVGGHSRSAGSNKPYQELAPVWRNALRTGQPLPIEK